MTIKFYPTAFEITDSSGELLAKVEAFDECTAIITINSVTNARQWKVLSAHIETALLEMRLDGDDES